MKPGKTGLRRLVNATGYSWQGLRASWQHEAAFRQELLLAVVLGATSFWLAQSVLQWLALITPLLLLLIVELLNSAIEAVLDRIGDEHHELAGRAKDMGSAAVLLCLLLVTLVWGTLCYERFFA